MVGPSTDPRTKRLQNEILPESRKPAQWDHDRIINCSAFRRLAEITQVVTPEYGYVVHNRLTHTIEVALVARRLAEKVIKESPAIASHLGIDPDVAQAAALAHDLGHPPFGHVAEEELDALVRGQDVADGFQGNAQSFRVVTKLAFKSSKITGLNLTRATLNAILKYPWFRGTSDKNKFKWGAYQTEKGEFKFARELSPPFSEQKCAEAELMDWADDFTYAVHDVADFYRAGLIPLDRLCSDKDSTERESFYEEVFARHHAAEIKVPFSKDDLREAFEKIIPNFPITEPYQGTPDQQDRLRDLTDGLLGGYMKALECQVPKTPDEDCVSLPESHKREIFLLKQLTWRYVIYDPALVMKQYGQRIIIRKLFEIFHKAAHNRKSHSIFPRTVQGELDEAGSDKEQQTRIVTDFISGMSERQAIQVHRSLGGH